MSKCRGGYSENDVLGCPDFDGDGWGDPEDGTDWKPMDPTQWKDSDGDQYGDNQFGEDHDYCPDEQGFSFEGDIRGCIDSDNDGWADIIDKFPEEPSQWNDTDGDGFGDQPNGKNADLCPEVAGVEEQDGCEAVIEESGGSILAYGGIAVGVLLVVIISGLVIMKLKGNEEEKSWDAGMPAMPNMNAQPAMPSMTAQPVMPNMNAQPVTPTISSQPAYQSDYTNYQQVQPAVQQASPSLDNLPGNPQVVAPVRAQQCMMLVPCEAMETNGWNILLEVVHGT